MKQCAYCAQEIIETALKCYHCGEWLAQKPKSESGGPDNIDDLYRRKVADDIRDQVESGLRKKYAWLGLVAVFLSGSGILLLVNNVLSGAQTNVAVAEALQKRNLRTLDDIESSLKKIAKIDSEMEEINRKAASAERKFATIEDFSRSGLGVSETLKQEIAKLNQTVATLARTLPASTDRELVISRVGEIDRALAGSKGDIDRVAQKIELAKFPVQVRDFKEAPRVSEKLIAGLKQRGYTVGYYARGLFGEEIERNKSISIGRNVPPEVAIPVIQAATEAAPFLTYIRFAPPGFDDNEIVVGATSQRSLEAGVRPFSPTDLVALTRMPQSQKEFQDKIRDLYKQ